MSATEQRTAGSGVAVLGTGIMGSAMARNLVRAGLSTTVWDRLLVLASGPAEAEAIVRPAFSASAARLALGKRHG